MRYGWIVCLMLAACNLNTPEPAMVSESLETGRLVVAWEQGGDLFLWRTVNAAAQQIASGDVVQPFVAPDGAQIAFTRGVKRTPESLWVVAAAGEESRQLVAPEPGTQIGDVFWQDENTLYFNTLSQAEPVFEPNYDLHRVDVPTGTVTQMQPAGEGGRIHISPDGRHILLVHPGRYGEIDARIRLYDPESNEVPHTLLAFPAVASASEFTFSPEIFWEAGSSAALVAIPDADAIYSEYTPEEAPPVQLWRLPMEEANDAAENIGAVQASFFGLPRWSEDGSQMVYYQRDAETGEQLLLANGDGTNAQVYESQMRSGSLNVLWLPDTTTFLYAQFLDDQDTYRYFLGNEDREPTILGSDVFILVQFLTAENYLAWFPSETSTAELHLLALSGESIAIASFEDVLPTVDAIWLAGE